MPASLVRHAALLLTCPVLLLAQNGKTAEKPLPLKYAPRPTTGAISAPDLMTRLYIFADDSMMGRETGTQGHVKSTAYLAAELKRLGLRPAGDEGTFFQNVPMIRRAFATRSTITVDGATLRGGTDFIASAGRGAMPRLGTLEVVFVGNAADTNSALAPEQVRGKLVLVLPAPRGLGGGGGGGRGGFGGRGGAGGSRQTAGAAAVATIEAITPQALRLATRPAEGQVSMKDAGNGSPATVTLTITPEAARTLLGVAVESATKGQAGKTATLNLAFDEQAAPARNVVAILPGADPLLKGQYVALGAHNDHVGLFTGSPVDHDSLHLYNQARFGIVGLVRRGQPRSAEQQAQVDAIRIAYDSVRTRHPVRLDSIRNGADDDGSGSVTLLEIAEAFSRAPAKPKRSLLFVWHTGEEKGLLGSRWVTDHLPVPPDSIVAQLNMDMVGRGAARDIPGGGDDYLQLVGSRRLSTELGDIVEQVNTKQRTPFHFDYQYDANGDPENIYCRSDHYNYARLGIPVAFFTTGLHGDYHQISDEPQYIDYPHMARIGQLVHDIALQVADLDHRPLVDKPKPDPNGRCLQ